MGAREGAYASGLWHRCVVEHNGVSLIVPRSVPPRKTQSVEGRGGEAKTIRTLTTPCFDLEKVN